MPGPCSVPNGDARLVRNALVCSIHGEKNARCEWDKACTKITQREFLFRRGGLETGKTQRKRGK